MTEPYHIISDLETHNSRINKEQIILAAAEAGHREFFEGCRLALDSMITFGVKSVPQRQGPDGPGLDWESFTLAITGLVSRQVTGNTARDMITTMMNAATNRQWNQWYRRILIKDLRCGVSEKTINKVVEHDWPEYAVPVFGCQLAHDSANHEAKIAGQKLIQVKLDGVRVITIVYPDGRVDQYSRNGKELVNFEHIKEELRANASTFTEPMVLDGEVMSSSFQDLMRQVHRKDNVAADDAVLWLFDALPLSAFEQGLCLIPQHQRLGWLDSWISRGLTKAMSNVRMLDHATIDLDTDQGQRLFSMYNKSAIENGYEGIMIKDPDAPYECRRTVSWLKLKPFIEVSLKVVETEEGTGRNQGKMGALVCEGLDDGRLIRVNVGSGFSDQQRLDFWDCRVDGHIVEVRADAVTQNQDGSYSLRFPRFVRFRGFEVNEKI